MQGEETMAQLKDTLVSGNLRVTDTTLTDTLQVTTIKAPSSSGGTTYTAGSNGQVLKSNGTTTYWGSDTSSDLRVRQTLTTVNEYHPLLMSYAQTSSSDTNIDNYTYRSNSIYVNPNSSTLYVNNIYCGGLESQSAYPSGGYHIYDCRSVNVTPSNGDKSVNFYFHMTDTPDTSKYWSVMHVKGWSGSYSAWEIAGPAHNVDQKTTPLYVRTSNVNTAWGTWRKIYDTSNVPTRTELGFGTIVSHAEGDYIPNTQAGVNAAINLLSEGTSTPADNDYYISQYVNGGTTTTTYHRRKMSALWGYINGKISASTTGTGDAVTSVTYSNGVISATKGGSFLASTTKYALSGSVGGTALRSNTLEVVATNEVRFYNDNQMKENKHFWFGYQWATGSHYTPSGGSDTQSTTAPNITKYIMGNCSGGYLADVQAKNFLIGNGSNPSSSSSVTTLAGTGTQNRSISFPDKDGTVALLSDIPSVSEYLPKTTYEWNKENGPMGASKAIKIGSFPMYDTTIAIDIDYSFSYNLMHGTVVIGTTNTSTTSAGSYKIAIYGDPTGELKGMLVVQWVSGSRNYNVYLKTAQYARVFIHIKALSNFMSSATDICTVVDSSAVPTSSSTSNLLTIQNVEHDAFNVWTGSGSDPARISFTTLLSWLINTKHIIPISRYCHITFTSTWSYASNDILQINVGGTDYEVQLAGCKFEFTGTYTDASSCNFTFKIYTAPATSFTVTTGYTKFPANSCAVYYNNGSGYSPTWTMAINSAGGTMLPSTSIIFPYNGGYNKFDGSEGLTVYAPDGAGWARGMSFNAGGTWYGGFGANGGSNTFSNFYIGKYNDPIAKFYSDKTSEFLNTVTVSTSSWTPLNLYRSGNASVTIGFKNKNASNVDTALGFIGMNTYSSGGGSYLYRWTADGNTSYTIIDSGNFSSYASISGNTITINGSSITSPTVNNASLTLKGSGTTVTTFTANASTNQSLDIVAGTNVTITPDVTNHKITIASSYTNTDTKVTQTITTDANTSYRPVILGMDFCQQSSPSAYAGATKIDTTYAAAKVLVAPKDGHLYVGGDIYAAKYHLNGSNSGLMAKDSTSTEYGLIYENGSNLWVGAAASNAYQHKGSLYLSTGWSGTLPTTVGTHTVGNATAYISVPKYVVTTAGAAGSWSYDAYNILHSGNTSFTQVLTSGTKIGTIKINGTPTDIYCQTNTNTDEKVKVTLATTSKAYLIGTTTSPNGTAVEGVADTGVYLDTTAGMLTATTFKAGNMIEVNNSSGMKVTANTSAEWARGIEFYVGSTATSGIGGRGSANAFSYLYMGKYDNNIARFYQSDKSTYFYGTVHLKANMYEVNPVETAMDCHNSNITGVNSLIFADDAGPGEGLMFYRNGSIWDSVWSLNGRLHYTPGYDPSASSNTSYDVLHSGNLERYGKHDGTFSFMSGTQFPVGPVTRHSINHLRADKLAFLAAANITIEYSTNNGSSWTSMGWTDDKKKNLFIGRRVNGLPIGPDNESTARTTSMQTRITITSDGRRTTLDQLYFDLDTSYQKISIEIKAKGNSSSSYTTIFTSDEISQWIYGFITNLPLSPRCYFSTNADDPYNSYQIIFKYTYIASSYSTYNNGTFIYTISGYTGCYWGQTINNMATLDHLYSWDNAQNAMFPATVSAQSFKGQLYRYTTEADPSTATDASVYDAYTMAYMQCSSDFAGTTGRRGSSGSNYWAHYLTFTHNSSYRYLLRLPFWGVPQYQHTTNGTNQRWYSFVTEEEFSAYKALQERYLEVTTTGWYRVLTLDSDSNSEARLIRDVTIYVRRNWNNEAPESFGIRMIFNYDIGGATYQVLYATQRTQCFTKIGVFRSSDYKKVYVQLYYDCSNKTNAFSIRYDTLKCSNRSISGYMPQSAMPDDGAISVVSDSPVELSKIDIPNNTAQLNLKFNTTSVTYGMSFADGSDYAWIRTTSQGLLPYQSGDWSNPHSYLGSPSDIFAYAYIANIYCQNVTSTGDIALKTTSGDTPSLIFQRGDMTSTYVDWKVYGSGGDLYFKENNGTDSAWETRVVFNYNQGPDFYGTTTVYDGNLRLYKGSGDSPALIFQRGTTIDNYNDWRIQDRGGNLYFDRDYNASQESWENKVYFDGSKNVFADFCGAAGKAQYISYPSDGSYTSGTANQTGAVIITTPFTTSTYTMVKFTVSIFNYVDGTTMDYVIQGYTYADGLWYRTDAVCTTRLTSSANDGHETMGNLTVRFGRNSSGKFQVQIGEAVARSNSDPATTWQYPAVFIRNIEMSHATRDFSSYKSGWNVTIGTSTISNVSSTISCTNVSTFASCLVPRFGNEINFQSPTGTYDTLWFGYRMLTSLGATDSNANTINLYNFGNGKGTATAKIRCGGVNVKESSNTYEAKIYPQSLTANRDIILPDADGAIGLMNSIYYNSTGSSSQTVVNGNKYRYFIITTKPASVTFEPSTIICPVNEGTGMEKHFLSWKGTMGESGSQSTRILEGVINCSFQSNGSCIITAVPASYYLTCGSTVSSTSTGTLSVNIIKIVGIKY